MWLILAIWNPMLHICFMRSLAIKSFNPYLFYDFFFDKNIQEKICEKYISDMKQNNVRFDMKTKKKEGKDDSRPQWLFV